MFYTNTKHHVTNKNEHLLGTMILPDRNIDHRNVTLCDDARIPATLLAYATIR